MASLFEDLKETVTEIRNDLICQICEDPVRPGKREWYRCRKLHQICRECTEETNFLCSCGQLISLEYCKQTEKLLNVKGLKFKCVNTKNGCQESLAESALEDHETDCIYRNVPCPNAALRPKESCEAKVTFQDVIQHYENSHYEMEEADLSKINVMDIFLTDISGQDGANEPKKFVLNNQTFFMADTLIDKVFYYWVYMLGSPNEAKHFSYTLKLFGLNSKITFEGKVAAIDEPFESLHKAGKCFTIPHKTFLALFVDENCDQKVFAVPKYAYSLEIRNLKEEAKDENIESGISDDEDSKE